MALAQPAFMRTRSYRLELMVAAISFTLALLPAALRAEPAPDIDVQVEKVGDEIRSVASFFVRAPRQRVWDVITDYDRAPEYMPDLEVSKIISRSPDMLRVKQRSHVRFGPFTFAIDSVRDVYLTEPSRAEARLVSGSMKKYEATTELTSEAGGTRVVYRSSAVPGSALASLAGKSLIRRETRDHFTLLRNEILRRQQLAATP